MLVVEEEVHQTLGPAAMAAMAAAAVAVVVGSAVAMALPTLAAAAVHLPPPVAQDSRVALA